MQSAKEKAGIPHIVTRVLFIWNFRSCLTLVGYFLMKQSLSVELYKSRPLEVLDFPILRIKVENLSRWNEMKSKF